MADFRRYRFGILAAFVMFLFANVFDYVRFSSLIPAYDYEIGYGVPFVFVVSGGFVTEPHHLEWSGRQPLCSTASRLCNHMGLQKVRANGGAIIQSETTLRRHVVAERRVLSDIAVGKPCNGIPFARRTEAPNTG